MSRASDELTPTVALVVLVILMLLLQHPACGQELANHEIKKSRILDTDFLLLNGAAMALTVADVESTHACLQHYPICREANPLYGRNPGRARMYATSLSLQGGLVLLSAWAKSKGGRGWAWIPTVSIGMRSVAFTVNLRNAGIAARRAVR